MKLKKQHWIGIIAGAVTIALDFAFFFFRDNKSFFFFILGIAIVVTALPFVLEIIARGKEEEEINGMFLEFSRNLAESVATGTPVSKSIINVSKKNFGPLSPYIEKLARQIELGIPVNIAMRTFARDVNNPVISRAVALIGEAEKAGGEIDYILESVAKSIAEVEKLKKERRAAISSLVAQGYIIFIIFIAIMLVMEFKILPLTAGLGSIGAGAETGISGIGIGTGKQIISPESLSRPFLYLLLAQGFFAGLIIGKLSEGKIKAGVKHSFILVILALLISTGAKAFLQ